MCEMIEAAKYVSYKSMGQNPSLEASSRYVSPKICRVLWNLKMY